MNTLKTFFLMLVLTGLLLLAGSFFGTEGVITALVISLIMNFAAYWFSDKLALAMARAHEIPREQDPELHDIIEEQARRAGIPKPKVYVVNTDSPNAFATGRSPKHAAVAVTTGIRRLLTRDELEGVIAHELAHVGNRDTLIMTVAAAVAGAIAWIGFMGRWAMLFGGFGGRDSNGNNNSAGTILGIVGLLVVVVVLPIVATLVRLAISRAREYQADATGAKTSGKPWALADALEKLEAGSRRRPMQVNEGVAHLFIVNPLSGESLINLLSTHPPIAERVRRLRNMRPVW